MEENRYQIAKPAHGSQEWLLARWQDDKGRKRIAASTAAAVHGEHKYMTPGDLATELLASEPPMPKPPTQAMERGNRMEPMIIEWVADEERIELFTPNELYCYDDGRARMVATLDAQDGTGTPFEIKTINKKWDGKLPPHWYWQGVQQSICSGMRDIEWRVFDSEMVIHRYKQTVSSDERQVHIEAVAKFLEAIDLGDVPDTAIMSYENMSELYSKSLPLQVELPAEASLMIADLEKVKSVIKELEMRESIIKADLGKLLQEAEEGVIDGEVVITWKEQKRTSFDSTRFDKERPELAKLYKKDTKFRVMKTKGRK